MKILARKTLRDLRAMKLRGLVILFIIACQAAIYAGGLCSRLTLRSTVDDFCARYRLADLQVSFYPVATGRLPSMDGIGGIQRVASRLGIKGSIRLGDGTALPAVVIFVRAGENPAINTLHVEEGAYPTRDNLGVVIERGLKGRGYRVGDPITVSAYGFTSTQKVVGIARSPEFLVSTANPEMLIPTPGSLGIVYAPAECCEKELWKFSYYLGGRDPVNQLLFLYGDHPPLRMPAAETGGGEGPREAILERLAGAGKMIRVENVLRREEQFGILFLDQDLKMFRVLVLAIVAVFSVITLIVTGISVNRVVMSQRRQIGALMAFGYGPGALMISCLRLGFVMGLAGGLAGAAASPAVNHLLAATYAAAIGLPAVTLAFSARVLAEGVLIGMLVASASAIAPAVALVRRTPVQAIRGGVDESLGCIAACARAGGALAGPLLRSTPQRAAARNLLRRPKLTAATILLAALGLGITAGFVITLTSILDSSTALLRRERWDVAADFTEPLSGAAAGALCERAGLADPEPVVRGYASIALGGRAGDYQLVGVPPDSTLRPLRVTAGREFSGDDADEIIFNASFSGSAPPAAGDTIVLTARGREHRLTVAGLISALSTGQAYVPIGTARRILGLGNTCTGFMARLNGAGAAAAREKLFASGRISRVTLRSELAGAIDAQLAKATRLIALAVILGAVVALAIMVNTMSMNILEREGEFATLMSLGYGRLPLARMVLTEVFAMGVAALVIAVPVAVGIACYMNAELSRVWFRIDTYLRLRELGMTLLVPFLLLPVGAVPALWHVFKLDVAQVTRERVIE